MGGCCGTAKDVQPSKEREANFTDLSEKKGAEPPAEKSGGKIPPKLNRYAANAGPTEDGNTSPSSQNPPPIVVTPAPAKTPAPVPVRPVEATPKTVATTDKPTTQDQTPSEGTATPSTAPPIQDYRKRLVIFFEKYNPARLDFVDGILDQYKGREDVLFESLIGKYGPEPGRENIPVAVAAIQKPAAAQPQQKEESKPEEKQPPQPTPQPTQPVTPQPSEVTPPAPAPTVVPSESTPPPVINTTNTNGEVLPPTQQQPQIAEPEKPAENAERPEPPKKFMGDEGMDVVTVDDIDNFVKPSSVAEVEAFDASDAVSPAKPVAVSAQPTEQQSTTQNPQETAPPAPVTSPDNHPRLVLWWQDKNSIHLTFSPDDCLSVSQVSPNVIRVACIPHYDTHLNLFAPVSKVELIEASNSESQRVRLTKSDQRNWFQLLGEAKEKYLGMDWIRRDLRTEDSSSDDE